MTDSSQLTSEEEFRFAFRQLAAFGSTDGPATDTFREALAVVFRFAAPRLRQSLRYRFRLGSGGLIEDAVQDVFVRLIARGVPNGDEPVRNPMAWLTKVAFNAARDALRRAPPSRDVGPEEASRRRTEHRVTTATGLPVDVEECLERLGTRERDVVQLWYEGFSGDEMAWMLQTTRNTVHVTFARAKKRLRRCLETPT